MLFRVFVCIFLFSVSFSEKAFSVQSGDMFWEIKKPGATASNYLMGIQHDVILNEDSLPPEILAALEETKTGLLEIVPSEVTEESVIEETKKYINFHPEKLFLSI